VYDGKGKVNGVFSFNFNGEVAAKFPRNFRDDGTYTVKADCTGATTYISEGVRYTTDLFIAPDGSMFTFVQTNPPERVTSGIELQGGRPSESKTEPLSPGGGCYALNSAPVPASPQYVNKPPAQEDGRDRRGGRKRGAVVRRMPRVGGLTSEAGILAV
jgi:hypothetical protein